MTTEPTKPAPAAGRWVTNADRRHWLEREQLARYCAEQERPAAEIERAFLMDAHGWPTAD